MNSMVGATGYRGSAGGNLSGNSAGSFNRQMSGKSIDRGDMVPKGYRTYQQQNFTPQQLAQHESLFQHVGPDSYLARLAGGDESFFNELEEPAWRQFQEAQGELGSRFSQLGQGAMSAQRGSGFKNAAGQLGSDFAMNLRAQRLNMRNQALKELMGYSSELLGQRPYEKYLMEKPERQKNFWQKLGGGALRAGGTAAGTYFGGPAGGRAGYAAGDEFANAFGV